MSENCLECMYAFYTSTHTYRCGMTGFWVNEGTEICSMFKQIDEKNCYKCIHYIGTNGEENIMCSQFIENIFRIPIEKCRKFSPILDESKFLKDKVSSIISILLEDLYKPPTKKIIKKLLEELK